jgi:exopolyphosphatase/guanosine-5'-triphosphate,3'-diphosphate pyrophosphatase
MGRVEPSETETRVQSLGPAEGRVRQKRSGVFARSTGPGRLAALDLRSGATHLLVADVGPRSFSIVGRAKEKIQLGQPVVHEARLPSDATSRGLNALRRLLAVADKAGATNVVAVASPAFRQSPAAAAFVRHAASELDIDIHTLDGAEQAGLLLAGVRSSVRLDERAVIFDLGGGSAELVLAEDTRALLSASLPIGTLRLRDLLGTRNLPDPAGIAEVERRAARYLAPTIWRVRRAGPHRLVLGCGVARRLWRLAEPRRKRGASLPPRGEARLTARDLDQLLFRLRGMTEKGRTFAIGAASGADTLLTGAIVLRTLARLLAVDEMTVSTTGMREGIVVTYCEGLREVR